MDELARRCVAQVAHQLLNTCGDVSALNEPFPGRPYPGDASVRRSERFDVNSSAIELMDLIAGSVPPQYAPLAEAFDNPNAAFLDPGSIVARVTVPAGFQVQTAQVSVSISDPEAENTVLFAVYNGTDLVVPQWDGATRNIVNIPVGGDRAVGGVEFTVRAIIDPDRWSGLGVIPAGSNPLRSQMKAYATLEVTSLADVPNGMRGECPPERAY